MGKPRFSTGWDIYMQLWMKYHILTVMCLFLTQLINVLKRRCTIHMWHISDMAVPVINHWTTTMVKSWCGSNTQTLVYKTYSEVCFLSCPSPKDVLHDDMKPCMYHVPLYQQGNGEAVQLCFSTVKCNLAQCVCSSVSWRQLNSNPQHSRFLSLIVPLMGFCPPRSSGDNATKSCVPADSGPNHSHRISKGN